VMRMLDQPFSSFDEAKAAVEETEHGAVFWHKGVHPAKAATDGSARCRIYLHCSNFIDAACTSRSECLSDNGEAETKTPPRCTCRYIVNCDGKGSWTVRSWMKARGLQADRQTNVHICSPDSRKPAVSPCSWKTWSDALRNSAAALLQVRHIQKPLATLRFLKKTHPSEKDLLSLRCVLNFRRHLQGAGNSAGRPGSESQQLVEYLRQRQSQDSEFFVSEKLSPTELSNTWRMDAVFWCTPKGRKKWANFNEVLIFDATYKCNSIEMPLVQFVGVDCWGKTFSCGNALVTNERAGSYLWVLEQWQLCMLKVLPRVAVTDGDLAMKRALSSIMPKTIHRLCRFHSDRNIRKHVQGLKPDIMAKFEFHMRRIKSTTMTSEFNGSTRAVIELLSENLQASVPYFQGIFKDAALSGWTVLDPSCVFAAGTFASQRAENKNRFDKESGLSSRCRPAQLVAILEEREDELEHNSKDQTAAGRRGSGRTEQSSPIIDWVRRQISPFAFEKFLTQYNKHSYYVVAPASAGAWQVSSPSQGGFTYGGCPSSIPGSVPDAPAAGGHRLVVQISDEHNEMLYRCTCGDDVIYGLPCRHILAVWAKTISPNLPSVAVLHPFWRNLSPLPAESALTALHMASEIRRQQMGHTSSAAHAQSDAGSQLTLSRIMVQSQDGTEMVRNFCSALTSSASQTAVGPAMATQALLPSLAFSPADYTACSSEVLRNLQQIVDRLARGPSSLCVRRCQEMLHEMFQMLDKYQTIAQNVALEQSVRALPSPGSRSGAADSVGLVEDTIVNPVPANTRGRPSSNALSFRVRSAESTGRRAMREAVQSSASRSDDLGPPVAPASAIPASSNSSSGPGRISPSEGAGTCLHELTPPPASVDLDLEEPVAKRTRKSHKCSACGSSDHQSNNRKCPVRRQLRDRRRGHASTGTSAA
jgi:hypothetical protein